MVGLWRDPGEGEDQPGQKGSAIRNGHPSQYRSPLDGSMPFRHTAQGTTITGGAAILQNGGNRLVTGLLAGLARYEGDGGAANAAPVLAEFSSC